MPGRCARGVWGGVVRVCVCGHLVPSHCRLGGTHTTARARGAAGERASRVDTAPASSTHPFHPSHIPLPLPFQQTATTPNRQSAVPCHKSSPNPSSSSPPPPCPSPSPPRPRVQCLRAASRAVAAQGPQQLVPLAMSLTVRARQVLLPLHPATSIATHRPRRVLLKAAARWPTTPATSMTTTSPNSSPV